MIYKTDSGKYVISSRGVWISGRFESERAAKYAFRFSDEIRLHLQEQANRAAGGTGGVITFEDLRAARKELEGGHKP